MYSYNLRTCAQVTKLFFSLFDPPMVNLRKMQYSSQMYPWGVERVPFHIPSASFRLRGLGLWAGLFAHVTTHQRVVRLATGIKSGSGLWLGNMPSY